MYALSQPASGFDFKTGLPIKASGGPQSGALGMFCNISSGPIDAASIDDAAHARVYSSEEWEAQRPLIERLYATGTLESTRAALQAAGFPVTVRQLKRKVRDWGLRKNLTKDEKEAIVQKESHAPGEIVFSIDNPLNRVITPARIRRMIKRDGIVPGPNSEFLSAVATPPDIKHETLAGNMATFIPKQDSRDLPGAPSMSYVESIHGDALIDEKLPIPLAESNPDVGAILDLEYIHDEQLPPLDGLLLNDGYSSDDESFQDNKAVLDNGPLSDDLTPPNGTKVADGDLVLGDSSHNVLEQNPRSVANHDDCPVAPSSRYQHLLHDIPADDDELLDDPYSSSIPVSEVFRPPATPGTDIWTRDTMGVEDPSESSLPPSNDIQPIREPSKSNELTLYQRPVAGYGAARASSREEALNHARHGAKILRDLRDVFRTLGVPEEEEDNAPKIASKRKRRIELVYLPASTQQPGGRTCSHSKGLHIRASRRDWNRMHAFGFKPVRQLDDSISMILPPPFDKPYLREVEDREREIVCEMDRLYGSDDERTLDALYNLAVTFRDQFRDSLAYFLMLKEGTARKRLVGEGHYDTIDSFVSLAQTMSNQKKYLEAANLLDRLESCVSYYLSDKGKVPLFGIRSLKSAQLANTGKVAEAEMQYRDLLETSKSMSGVRQRNILLATLNLSFVLRKQGKLLESEDILKDVIRSAEKVQEEWSVMLILEAKRQLACSLEFEGRTAEGERLHQIVNDELEILRPGIDPRGDIVY